MINHLQPQKNRQIKLTAIDSVGNINHLQNDQTKAACQPDWQHQLTDAITDVDTLLSMLDLQNFQASTYIPKHFKLRVPRGFVAKMQKGDAADPLLRQVLPDYRETQGVTGFTTDPLAEQHVNPIKGLLHKYQSRVLITVTGACAIHCRYCFRQHFDYQANLPSRTELVTITNYIEAHPEVNEVILSGGDPLNVSNRRLFIWLEAIESLPHVQTIRLHTRLPVVIPERLDDTLLSRLQSSRCQIVMVVHCNHANEIDAHTAEYLQRASRYGVMLLNQAVLLKGINDTVQAQISLSQRLFAAGVLPYYLHILDKVQGAAHFDQSIHRAITLYWQILEKLPGYLVPKLVQELPSKPFKTPVDIYQNR